MEVTRTQDENAWKDQELPRHLPKAKRKRLYHTQRHARRGRKSKKERPSPGSSRCQAPETSKARTDNAGSEGKGAMQGLEKGVTGCKA